jgi:hypothetical protein
MLQRALHPIGRGSILARCMSLYQLGTGTNRAIVNKKSSQSQSTYFLYYFNSNARGLQTLLVDLADSLNALYLR